MSGYIKIAAPKTKEDNKNTIFSALDSSYKAFLKKEEEKEKIEKENAKKKNKS